MAGKDGGITVPIQYVDIKTYPDISKIDLTNSGIIFKNTNVSIGDGGVYIVNPVSPNGTNLEIHATTGKTDFNIPLKDNSKSCYSVSIDNNVIVKMDEKGDSLPTLQKSENEFLQHNGSWINKSGRSIISSETTTYSNAFNAKYYTTSQLLSSDASMMYAVVAVEVDVEYAPNKGKQKNVDYRVDWASCQGTYSSTVKDGNVVNNSSVVYMPSDMVASKAYKMNPLMTMRQLTRPTYLINENVIGYWMNVINSPCAAQCVLNKLRDYIKSNPALIMLNKACRVMKPYAEKIFSKSDASTKDIDFNLVNIPLGPPLMHLPKTTLIELSNHGASYGMVAHEQFNKYDDNAVNVNIINRLYYDKKTGTDGNYLDYLLQKLVEGVLVNYSEVLTTDGTGVIQNANVLDDNTYFVVMLPSKGLQVLDIISNTTAAILRGNGIGIVKSDTWLNTNSVAWQPDVPKVLMTFQPLKNAEDGTGCGNSSASAAIASAYNYIASVSVPWVCMHKSKGAPFIQVRIETRTSEETCKQSASVKSPVYATEPEGYDDALKKYNKADGTTKDGNEPSTPSGNDGNEPSTPSETFKPKKASGRIVERYDGEKQKDSSGSKFAGAGSVPSNNRLYIYVTEGEKCDFTSTCRGNAGETSTDSSANNIKNGRANIMLHMDYIGIDAMYPPFCLSNRKFGNYCGQ